MNAPAHYAGIDEAGYGPLLGPLVSARFSYTATAPDLWSLLKLAVRPPGKAPGDNRLVVGDSKVVYAGRSMRLLERTVLAFTALSCGRVPKNGDDALDMLTGQPAENIFKAHPWLSDSNEPWPLANSTADIFAATKLLTDTSKESALHNVALKAVVLPVREFNTRVEHVNKADVLCDVVCSHLEALSGQSGELDLYVFADRLSGRKHYGSIALQAFMGTLFEDVSETPQCSRYRFAHGNRTVDVRFAVKADREYFAAALAGMTAKYIRELLMGRLNRFFSASGAAPTAGYYVDGQRFLGDTTRYRREMNIADKDFIRSR